MQSRRLCVMAPSSDDCVRQFNPANINRVRRAIVSVMDAVIRNILVFLLCLARKTPIEQHQMQYNSSAWTVPKTRGTPRARKSVFRWVPIEYRHRFPLIETLEQFNLIGPRIFACELMMKAVDFFFDRWLNMQKKLKSQRKQFELFADNIMEMYTRFCRRTLLVFGEQPSWAVAANQKSRSKTFGYLRN